MVRKGSWFSSLKSALSPHSKEKKAKKENKSKKKWFGKEKQSVPDDSPIPEIIEASPPPPEDVNISDVENEQQTKHAYSVAVATAAAAEAAVEVARAAAEVVRLSTVTRFAGKSKEETAAIRIQTAFRGHMARRALRALRGLVRLKSLADGPTIKRQTANTLRCMQTLSRVQSQIQSRRIRMSEENQALQRQILQKRAKEIESLRTGDEWDDSLQSKEKVEANLLHKFEATMRRERALAYSYTHQQTLKKSSKPTNLLFMDPTNPQWGWSWLERWMASNQPETQPTRINSGGEITKSYIRHQLNSDSPPPAAPVPPPDHHSPASFAAYSKKSKGSVTSRDDDSTLSVQTERINRRHSIAGSSVRDDESLASSPNAPSYMGTTKSARAKSRFSSPVGPENVINTPVGSAKKRLSFPQSPARPRRHSGPPKIEIFTKDVNGVVN